MKTQRSIFIALGGMALAAVVALAVTACSQRKQPVFEDLPGLISAVQAFSQDLTKQGLPLPSSVSLGELVNRGYISTNSVRAFEGVEARIWLTVNPTEPQSVLMSARLPDGRVNAALADGSVQQLSAQRFAEHLRKTGQPDSAANRSQPVRSETNSTSPAAGSGR